MRLSDAANYFDRTTVSDAYTPTVSFLAQLSLYADQLRDNIMADRRILDCSPGTSMFARGACSISGVNYIVGNMNPDEYNGSVIRNSYVLQRAGDLSQLLTCLQYLSGTPGVSAYTSRIWAKDVKESQTSEYENEYSIYLANAEKVVDGMIILYQGIPHFVRNVLEAVGGFQVAQANELELLNTALQNVTLTKRSATYNPVTEAYTPSTTTVPAIFMRWKDDFIYPNKAVEHYEWGDFRARLRNTDIVNVKQNDQITANGITWTILSIQDRGDGTSSLHLREV